MLDSKRTAMPKRQTTRPRLIKPSDLRREAQRLIASGEMPPLEKLLAAVAEAREKYGARLKAARRSE
jgi:hypothetical protein